MVGYQIIGREYENLNTQWKLIALGTFAVMVTIWAGSVMEAKTGQDYTAQSARVTSAGTRGCD